MMACMKGSAKVKMSAMQFICIEERMCLNVCLSVCQLVRVTSLKLRNAFAPPSTGEEKLNKSLSDHTGAWRKAKTETTVFVHSIYYSFNKVNTSFIYAEKKDY